MSNLIANVAQRWPSSELRLHHSGSPALVARDSSVSWPSSELRLHHSGSPALVARDSSVSWPSSELRLHRPELLDLELADGGVVEEALGDGLVHRAQIALERHRGGREADGDHL